MNDPPITEDDLNGYVDDALDPVRRVRVEAYLAAHAEVAERVAGYAKQRDLLRAAFAPIFVEPVPPELNPASIVEARRRPGLTRGRGALAAALLLCGGAAGGWALRGALGPPTEGVAALAQEAADSYAVYVPDRERPVELRAAERATLVDWASARLRRPVAVPDLAASGYRFMGGRVVVTSHGPAVLYMYDDDRGSRLVLLVRLMAVERNAPIAEHSFGAVTGFAWADRGVGYSLVGPAARSGLHALAAEVRRQVGPDA